MIPLEFPEAKRQIFQHLSGERKPVFADPAVIERSLAKSARAAGIDLLERLDVLRKAYERYSDRDPLIQLSMDEAIADVIPVIHAAFGTSPLGPDGSGLTEAEAMENLNLYYAYLADLKKNTSTPPGSSRSPDGPPATS